MRAFLFILFLCVVVGATHAALILTEEDILQGGIAHGQLFCIDDIPQISGFPNVPVTGTVLNYDIFPAEIPQLLDVSPFPFAVLPNTYGVPLDIESLLGTGQTIYLVNPEGIVMGYLPTPEPTSFILLGIGVILLRRRKKV